MILSLLVILPAISLETYNNNNLCYQFSCDNSKLSRLYELCVTVYHDKKEIIFTGCDSNENLFCNYTSNYYLPERLWTNQTCYYLNVFTACDEDKISYLETGEKCCYNSECKSNKCKDSYCAGKAPDEYCLTHEECRPSTYCHLNYCTRLKNIGDSCESDYECPIGAGCNLNKCVKIFSLGSGNATSDKKFCKSNFEIDGICDLYTIRLSGKDNKLASPYLCLVGQSCEFYTWNGTLIFEENCMCGAKKNLPEGFCGYYLDKVSGVMDFVYNELQYSTSICSGKNAHSSQPGVLVLCKSISTSKFELYYNLYNQAINWNIYVAGAIDSCAYNLELWNPNYTIYDYEWSIFYNFIFALLLINL